MLAMFTCVFDKNEMNGMLQLCIRVRGKTEAKYVYDHMLI